MHALRSLAKQATLQAGSLVPSAATTSVAGTLASAAAAKAAAAKLAKQKKGGWWDVLISTGKVGGTES